MKKVASIKRSPSVIQYEAGCNALADEFIRKYELSYADMHWVGDNAGDICCIGDWFFSTEAMKVAIDYDVDWSDLMAWYDYTIDSQMLHLITPNLESWVKGCPRASEEQLKVLRKLNEQHLLKSSYE